LILNFFGVVSRLFEVKRFWWRHSESCLD